MNSFQQFIQFLTSNGASAGHRQPASQPISSSPSSVASKSSSTSADNAHIQRKKVAFKQVGPNDIVSEMEEQWLQKGSVTEGESVQTRVIAASGQLVSANKLKSVCSICNRLEDTVIRSEQSHVALCRTCQRIFEMPDGKKIVVTPSEYLVLEKEFDTWAKHDAKRKGKIE